MTRAQTMIAAAALCAVAVSSVGIGSETGDGLVHDDLQAYMGARTAPYRNLTTFSFGVYSDIHMIDNAAYGLTAVQWTRLLTHWRDRGDLFGFIVGDLGYGNVADIPRVLAGPASVPGAPLMFYTMGNHEVDGVGKRAWIDGLYPGAVQPSSWTVLPIVAPGNADRLYWSFDIGPSTHFIVLDGNDVTIDGTTQRIWQTFGQEQLTWLAADISQNATKNILVFVHEPIDQQTTGSTPFYTLNDKGGLIDLLRAHPKQSFVFSGHLHSLSGITRWKGITSVHVMSGADPAFGVRVSVNGEQISLSGLVTPNDFDQHPMNRIDTVGSDQVVSVAEDGSPSGNTREPRMTVVGPENGVTPTRGSLMLKTTSLTWYSPRFISEQLIKIVPGMKFSFDMLLMDVINGLDAVTVQPHWYIKDGSMPPYVMDQNGIQLSRRPRDGSFFSTNEDVPLLGGRATNQWYHREFDLTPLAGQYVDGVYLTSAALKVNVGTVYVDNIRFTWPASYVPPPVTNQTLFMAQAPAFGNVIDNVDYELGLRFFSDVAGQITHVRYWKSPTETGTHIGRIWSPTGQLLASATFLGETAAGWQQQALPTPLTITAGQIYTVSVNTTNRSYVATSDVFLTDVVTGSLHAPGGVNGVYAAAAPGTFPTRSYRSTNYFRDVVFAPAGAPPPPPPPSSQSLLTTQVPVSPNVIDNIDYELGLRFFTDAPGQVTAIRYWKAPAETGVHVGRIWSSTGQLLASVAFTGETASGWQQQALPTALTLAANQTYVVSVNTTNRAYVATSDVFTGEMVNGSLHAPAGGNGVYAAALPGVFPVNSYRNTNYFRDVVFVRQ